MNLKNARILVTGGSLGIGNVAAKVLGVSVCTLAAQSFVYYVKDMTA